MKRFLRRIVALMTVLLVTAGSWHAVSAETIRTISMSDLEALVNETGDKIVVLNFFASWCGPCRMEIPDLVELRKHYPSDRLTLMGISVDRNADELQAFVRKMGVNYPVYRDNSEIARELGISSIPRTIILDGKGEVVLDEAGLVPLQTLIKRIDAL